MEAVEAKLRDDKAWPDRRDMRYRTPLHRACAAAAPFCVIAALASRGRGALTAANLLGIVPLHLAVEASGRMRCGASRDLPEDTGVTEEAVRGRTTAQNAAAAAARAALRPRCACTQPVDEVAAASSVAACHEPPPPHRGEKPVRCYGGATCALRGFRTVELLLALRPKTMVLVDKAGRNALHFACSNGPTHERRVGRATNAPPEVLRLLLAAEGAAAAVRAQTNATGQLPLHVAVMNLAPREFLAPLVDAAYGGCAAGAATRDKYGHTPASYAVLYFKPDDLTKSNHARQEARKTVRLLEDAAAAPLPSMPPDGQRRRASVFAK